MNLSSHTLRSATLAALVASASLLLGACATTSASLDKGEKSVSAAKLHAMMERVAQESTDKGAVDSSTSRPESEAGLASNP